MLSDEWLEVLRQRVQMMGMTAPGWMYKEDMTALLNEIARLKALEASLALLDEHQGTPITITSNGTYYEASISHFAGSLSMWNAGEPQTAETLPEAIRRAFAVEDYD